MPKVMTVDIDSLKDIINDFYIEKEAGVRICKMCYTVTRMHKSYSEASGDIIVHHDEPGRHDTECPVSRLEDKMFETFKKHRDALDFQMKLISSGKPL